MTFPTRRVNIVAFMILWMRSTNEDVVEWPRCVGEFNFSRRYTLSFLPKTRNEKGIESELT